MIARALVLAFVVPAFVMLLAPMAALAQRAGDIASNPLPSIVAGSLEDSIRTQVLDPGKAEIRVLVHFPSGRGENGRICGEVIEPAEGGKRVRTFYSTYTRSGRVLTRFDDLPFEEFLERDTVFRNCRPRL